MKTTMKPKERIRMQVSIYRDLQKSNERRAVEYEDKQKTESWAVHSYNAANVRAVTYELVADDLEKILKDWDEMEGEKE